MKNILISTGGSGGHVVPAKILSEHLHSNFNVFICDDGRRDYSGANNERCYWIDYHANSRDIAV